jgi:hypothetical protein
MSQYGFGMCGRPAIGKHLFELGVLSMEPHQKFSNIRPRFNTMSFRAGQDRVQHGCPRSGIFTPQEQPCCASEHSGLFARELAIFPHGNLRFDVFPFEILLGSCERRM